QDSARRRSRYLLFCLVGGTLVLVIACWLWFTRGPELATLRGHRGMVRSLALSPNGALLASGGEDHQICVWDAATYRLRLTLEGHRKSIRTVVFSPDGRLLASGGEDGTLFLWDWKMGKSVARWRVAGGRIYALAFTPDNRTLAATMTGAGVQLWDVTTRQERP